MKRLAVICALCAAASGCGGAQQQAPDPGLLDDERADPYAFNLSVAYSLLATHQPMEASRVARRLLAMDEHAVEPYYVLARAYLDMRQLEAAEKMLREALRRDPILAKGYALHGTLLDLRGRHEAALAKHRQAIALEPENAAFRNNLGFSLYLAGKYRRAITAFRRALERDSGLRRVHNNLGFAYGRLGDMKSASQHFALAGPPAQVSNNLGVLHEDRGELEAAYAYYLTAAQIDPQLVPARANLRRVCQALGRPLPELPAENAQARALVEPVDAELPLDAEPPRAPAAPAAAPQPATPDPAKTVEAKP